MILEGFVAIGGVVDEVGIIVSIVAGYRVALKVDMIQARPELHHMSGVQSDVVDDVGQIEHTTGTLG